MLEKKVALLKEAKKIISTEKSRIRELSLLLTDTNNVRLHHEQIIRNLMKNEKRGYPKTVKKVIAETART